MLVAFKSFVLSASLFFACGANAGVFEKLCEIFLKKKTPVVQARVPKVKYAPEKIEKKPNLWIDDQYKDPDWVMSEARRVFDELDALPTEQRNQVHIEYFRGQIPLLTHILKTLRPAANVKYWMIGLDGQPLENGVETAQQAIARLMEEGTSHYFNRTATLEWFPNFVFQVISLRWFLHKNATAKWIMPEREEFQTWYRKLRSQKAYAIQRESSNWFLFHMTRNQDLFKSDLQNRALHWPTVALLNMRHFDDWHLEIKPLGYSEDGLAYADGVQTDDFDVFDHDLSFHFLPAKFQPYKKQFARFKNIFDAKVANEKWDQQVLMRILWFEATHERAPLYNLFVKLRENKNASLLQLVSDMMEQYLWVPGKSDYFASQQNIRVRGELTESLKRMTSEQQNKAVGEMFLTFRRYLIESFHEFDNAL